MKLLLDTQIILWHLEEAGRQSSAAASLIEDTSNEVVFSAVSIWEIAIKSALGKRDFDVVPDTIYQELIRKNFTELAVASRHGLRVLSLPLHHHDPFDRLLLAQAIEEGLTLVTADKKLAQYAGPILHV